MAGEAMMGLICNLLEAGAMRAHGPDMRPRRRPAVLAGQAA